MKNRDLILFINVSGIGRWFKNYWILLLILIIITLKF